MKRHLQLFGTSLAIAIMAVGDRFTVLYRGRTLGSAERGKINPEQLQDLMAGGQELAELEGSLGGTV